MIVQCPACRALVDVSAATIDGDQRRAGLTCSACGAVTWLGEGAPVVEGGRSVTAPSTPSTSKEAATPAVAPGAASVERPGADAPDDLEALKAAVEAIDVVDAEETKAAFIELLGRWHDDDAHKKVIQRGLLAGQLAVVGQGYRAVLEQRGEDTMSAKGRDRVLASAMTQLKDLPREDITAGSSKKVINAIAIAASVLVMALCGYYIFSIAMPQLADPERALQQEGKVQGAPVKTLPGRRAPPDKRLPSAR